MDRIIGTTREASRQCYRWPYEPPSPAQPSPTRPEHDAAQAQDGPARREPTDFVLVLGDTMGYVHSPALARG
jgi:hypothetical protein